MGVYPFIACEVIACEVWGIFDSALSNIDMLVKFWEFLDRPSPLNPVQASYFAKVIGVFLMKKTTEMLQFIKSQPEVVPKLLLHMSTSSIMDLLLKIISMEESPEGKGTVQWLSEQGLMPWLVNQLDPNFDAEIHSVASQVLLDIIAISQSSHPEQPSIGTNILIDELKSEVIVTKLVGFMLDRTAPHSTSTLINGVTIFIELIRRNNSDYDVEPLPPHASELIREPVDLSDLLKVLASRIEDFKDLLVVPRSVTGPIETSIGKQVPLGFERLKICEMFAELLHCSNMAVLNSRPIISVSSDGTVKVPTVAADQPFQHFQSQHVKEEADTALAGAVAGNEPAKVEQEPKGSTENEKEQTLKSDDQAEQTQPTASAVEPKNEAENATEKQSEKPTEKIENSAATQAVDDQATPKASPPLAPVATSVSSTTGTTISHATADNEVLIPVGDFLKLQFVDHRIIPTCFDLFFQFPWNNFLHTVVYDMVHQVFHRPMGDIGRPDVNGTYIPPRNDQGITEGWNRRLTISIFKDGQLTKRITDAQRLCDQECAQPKGVRLGYMGHLTYIADETVKLLELYSQTSLLSMLQEFIDADDWWSYVSKTLKETKERDAQILGGSRPNVLESHQSGLDDGHDDDFMDDNGEDYVGGNGFLGEHGGVGPEGDGTSDQFARYLSQQIASNMSQKFGSSDEDDDEEEGNWISEYGVETDIMRRRAAAASSVDDPFGNQQHAMGFDDSDEDDEGVDDGSWNSPWPTTFGEPKISELGATTQFSATLTDWSEDFQDGFTEFKTADDGFSEFKTADDGFSEFKTGEDGKDEFDFPPFSAAASDLQKTTITPAESDPFGDDFVVETPSNAVMTVDTSEASKGAEQTKDSSNVEMEPVKLGPKVHETPVIDANDIASESQGSNQQSPAAASATSQSTSTAVSSSPAPDTKAESDQSAPSTVAMEPVPLADPEAPKLQTTISSDAASLPTTSTTTAKDANVEVAEIAKKVEDLDLQKDSKDTKGN
ncbi:hypothetical protein BGZ50_001126 [Haplosporangium sp. Z 11]|nr:hypothetical protein BGZ50_001126 [Haplosporangium sp. Z 11]